MTGNTLLARNRRPAFHEIETGVNLGRPVKGRGMGFYCIEPEIAGELGESSDMDASVHPPLVSSVHYVITDWLGDDIVGSFPCYLVTPQLAAALESSNVTGLRFDAARVTLSAEAVELGITEIPAFRWLVITGRPGDEDFGVLPNGQAVISEEALQVLQAHTLENCDIAPYTS